MHNMGFFGPPKTSPCKCCNDRNAECHASCEAYLAFVKKVKIDRIKRFKSYVPGDYKYDPARIRRN